MSLLSNFFLRFFKTRSIHFYILFFLLFLAAILRFYNYPYRYSLGEETVRDAIIGIEGARQLQFPLTGAFSSLGPFTFGPWYQYQLIIATLLLHHLYSPWIYLSIFSLLYIVVAYKIGELLIDRNFALILATLAVFSPAQIISATHLTSHNATNLFAVLAIWIFLKIIKKDVSYWWGFALGLVIGIGANLHFQMVGLLIIFLLLLVYKPKRYLYFVTGSVGVFFSFLPLLFFEWNNHWFNVRNMYIYMLDTRNLIYVPNRWLFYLRDFWPSFWADGLGIPTPFAGVIIIGFFASIGFAAYKKKLTVSWILLLFAFFSIFVGLRYYWGPKFFGYLNFVRPFVFIFTAYFLYSIARIKYGVYISCGVLLAIIFLSMPRNISQLQPDPFSMSIYTGVNEIVYKYPQKKFEIFECSQKYSSYYNASVFSTLFVLDLYERVGNGVKIGIDGGGCKYPITEKEKKELAENSFMKQREYTRISSVGIIDFSTLSEKELEISDWKKITMPQVYNAYARWWFKQQP